MLRTDWTVPQIDHPGVDMYRRRRRVVLHDEHPLPYAGLPRDRIEQATAVALMFDPDQVFLFGSTLRGEDGFGSDIDLLVAFDGIPLDVRDQWEEQDQVQGSALLPLSSECLRDRCRGSDP